jgi:hypothetical protein
MNHIEQLIGRLPLGILAPIMAALGWLAFIAGYCLALTVL